MDDDGLSKGFSSSETTKSILATLSFLVLGWFFCDDERCF